MQCCGPSDVLLQDGCTTLSGQQSVKVEHALQRVSTASTACMQCRILLRRPDAYSATALVQAEDTFG